MFSVLTPSSFVNLKKGMSSSSSSSSSSISTQDQTLSDDVENEAINTLCSLASSLSIPKSPSSLSSSSSITKPKPILSSSSLPPPLSSLPQIYILNPIDLVHLNHKELDKEGILIVGFSKNTIEVSDIALIKLNPENIPHQNSKTLLHYWFLKDLVHPTLKKGMSSSSSPSSYRQDNIFYGHLESSQESQTLSSNYFKYCELLKNQQSTSYPLELSSAYLFELQNSFAIDSSNPIEKSKCESLDPRCEYISSSTKKDIIYQKKSIYDWRTQNYIREYAQHIQHSKCLVALRDHIAAGKSLILLDELAPSLAQVGRYFSSSAPRFNITSESLGFITSKGISISKDSTLFFIQNYHFWFSYCFTIGLLLLKNNIK